jgi:hypothetical protein
MEVEKIQTYKQKFLIELKKLSKDLTSTKITNQQIGNCFKELERQDVSTVLEHLEKDGFIEIKHSEPFLNKNIIKSFVLTQKGLSYK